MTQEHRNRTPPGAAETGILLLELVIVIPMFFIMTIFVLEYVHVLEQKQLLTTLNRETANMGFRECSRLNTQVLQLTCLARVRNFMEGTGNNLFGRAPEVILAIYEKQPTGVEQLAISPGDGITESLHTSRFVEYDAQFNSAQFQDGLGSAGRAFISETYLQYRPRLLSNIPFVWDLSLTTFYDVTVYTTKDG